jgi:hypothetical protein
LLSVLRRSIDGPVSCVRVGRFKRQEAGPRERPAGGGQPQRPLPVFGASETLGSQFAYLAAPRQGREPRPGAGGPADAALPFGPTGPPQRAHTPTHARDAQGSQGGGPQQPPIPPRRKTLPNFCSHRLQ